MNDDRLTVQEVAAVLHLSEKSVRALIDAGDLAAINVSRSGSNRPTYRITRSALIEFERNRATVKPVEPRKTKRKFQPVTEYFR